MRKKTSLVLLLLCCVLTIITVLTNKSEINSDSFLIENIEALTSGEDVSGVIECTGSGGLYCPLDRKSEYKMVIVYQ